MRYGTPVTVDHDGDLYYGFVAGKTVHSNAVAVAASTISLFNGQVIVAPDTEVYERPMTYDSVVLAGDIAYAAWVQMRDVADQGIEEKMAEFIGAEGLEGHLSFSLAHAVNVFNEMLAESREDLRHWVTKAREYHLELNALRRNGGAAPDDTSGL
jgi:hypothetical protein